MQYAPALGEFLHQKCIRIYGGNRFGFKLQDLCLNMHVQIHEQNQYINAIIILIV